MDFTTFAGALAWVMAHGYGLLFLALLIEGPIITAAASFAAALGYFNLVAVFVLALLGDLLADFLFYTIGYFSRLTLIEHYGHRLGMTHARMMTLQSLLDRHAGKTIVAIKLAPFLPAAGLIVVGSSHMSFRKFAFVSFAITLPKVLSFMMIGFYFGYLYDTASRYLGYGTYLALAALLLFIIRYGYLRITASISKEIEEI